MSVSLVLPASYHIHLIIPFFFYCLQTWKTTSKKFGYINLTNSNTFQCNRLSLFKLQTKRLKAFSLYCLYWQTKLLSRGGFGLDIQWQMNNLLSCSWFNCDHVFMKGFYILPVYRNVYNFKTHYAAYVEFPQNIQFVRALYCKHLKAGKYSA